jgi:hypothetical protein
MFESCERECSVRYIIRSCMFGSSELGSSCKLVQIAFKALALNLGLAAIVVRVEMASTHDKINLHTFQQQDSSS